MIAGMSILLLCCHVVAQDTTKDAKKNKRSEQKKDRTKRRDSGGTVRPYNDSTQWNHPDGNMWTDTASLKKGK